MATYSTCPLNSYTASKTKNGSVELVISQNGKQKIISTGVHLKKHEWKNGMVVGRFDSHELNKIIQSNLQPDIRT